MKSLLLVITSAVGLLALSLVYNTLRLQPAGAPPAFSAVLPDIPAAPAAQRLAESLRFRTISQDQPVQPLANEFAGFNSYLEQQYPAVHQRLQVEAINQHSRLYRWVGKNPDAPGLLLLAHSDVVPVEPGTESQWQQPAFGGVIADGHIWGRGTLDDKSSVLAWLEAFEYLLQLGFEPAIDIWLAIGHDEEVGGRFGAVAMAEQLRQRGERFSLALDEGGAITRGMAPGVERPVASIMAAEKGYVTLELIASGSGGHSSTPPMKTAVGRLSAAVARLETEQMPRHLRPPVSTMLERIAPELPWVSRMAIANRWLLEPLLLSSFGKTRVGNALLRTTTAPTMLDAGIKDNVLATQASAVVNFRVLPGDSVTEVEQHVAAVVDDPAITIRRYSPFVSEPSEVSDINSAAYMHIAGAVRDVFPNALLSTGVVTGATDLRHYRGLYAQRFNFVPLTYQPDDLERFHGTDERVSVEAYRKMVICYIRLLQRAASIAD